MNRLRVSAFEICEIGGVMKIEMQRGDHYIAFHRNGQDEPTVQKYADGEVAAAATVAERAFWGHVQDRAVNWVKFWTIRSTDGLYLFNAEFQKRTPR